MKTIHAALALGLLMFSQVSPASIIAQIGSTAITPTAIEDFSTPGSFLPDDTVWIGSDITLKDVGSYNGFVNSNTGNLSSEGLYQNGGTYGYVSLALNTGADIDAAQFELSNGWGPDTPQYVWIRALADGVFTGYDFDLDLLTAPGTVSVISMGTVFDELQIFVTNNESSRNSHSMTMYSAVAIDNILIGSAGTSGGSVPVPAPLALMGLGLVGLGLSRRLKSE